MNPKISVHDNIPKLPDQDIFLLELQNNNYSMQTVLNYARDLSIFAVFLHINQYSFDKIGKNEITLYKGYLQNGNHLKDLDIIRHSFMKNVGIPPKNTLRTYKGSKSNDTDLGGLSSPLNVNEKYRNNSEVFKFEFLENVYRKVFGSLGIYEKPLNSSSRNMKGLDPKSVNRMLSAIRSFLKFRIDRDLDIPLAPDAIKLVKADKKISQVASLEELIKLIESPLQFESDNLVGIRNRCMLELLFSTGMRISELINLNLDQINSEGSLFILGKGKKERYVYLTQRAMEWLDRYLEVRLQFVNGEVRETSSGEDVSSYELKDFSIEGEKYRYIKLCEGYRQSGYLDKFASPALFIPFKKKSLRLSTNYFQECIAKYRRRLGIMVHTSAHSLRHGFATYLAENEANPAAIQVLLGHESLNTTTRYVHASDNFARKTHREKHPLKVS